MPTGVPIVFGQGQDSGLEPLAGATELTVNALADASKTVRKRPGIVRWLDFPAPAIASEVQALAIFGDYIVYVTADRKIHSWLGSGLVQELSDATAATQLDGDQRPIITVTKTRAIFSGGGLIQYWDGAAALSARLPGSPPTCTHAVAANTRLIVNARDNSGQIKWSEAGELLGHLDWTHGNFLELESFPDPCNALYSSAGELVGFGTKSVQMLVADPVAGYLTARTFQIGTLAPYSYVADDSDFAFVDHLKRVVRADGRSFRVASSPSIARTLKGLTTISDCWGARINQDAWNLLVFVFPTEKRAFVFNTEGQTWSEWRGRSTVGWTAVPFSSYCHFPARDLHLVGCSDGRIKLLSFSAATDDGGTLHTEMLSGFMDHGSKKTKLCEDIRLTFRTTPGTTPQVTLAWRDDQGAFLSENTVTLQVDEENVVELRTLGEYRTRQWKLILDDTVPMTLVAAEEDLQLLEM